VHSEPHEQTSSAYPALAPPIKVPLVIVPDHACSYLPGRLARTRAFATRSLPGQIYHQFMDAAFRRSGTIFYQPVCAGCRQCIPIRVPVATFTPSKSQRRSRRRNADLTATVAPPRPTDEKFDLYKRYMSEWHDKPDAADRESFESFLYDSPVETIEICHRDPRGWLLGVGICDICPSSLSSVYFYFDPAESRRALGTYSALYEIELARRLSIPHYYLGYWVSGCGAMDYKATYRPCEALGTDGVWRALATPPTRHAADTDHSPSPLR
jgi:arginine-tRNA-protein transferase